MGEKRGDYVLIKGIYYRLSIIGAVRVSTNTITLFNQNMEILDEIVGIDEKQTEEILTLIMGKKDTLKKAQPKKKEG